MPVKPIFGSYPYLKIARDSGLRYEIILAVADMYVHNRVVPGIVATDEEVELINSYQESILLAASNFKRIQNEGWDQTDA